MSGSVGIYPNQFKDYVPNFLFILCHTVYRTIYNFRLQPSLTTKEDINHNMLHHEISLPPQCIFQCVWMSSLKIYQNSSYNFFHLYYYYYYYYYYYPIKKYYWYQYQQLPNFLSQKKKNYKKIKIMFYWQYVGWCYKYYLYFYYVVIITTTTTIQFNTFSSRMALCCTSQWGGCRLHNLFI